MSRTNKPPVFVNDTDTPKAKKMSKRLAITPRSRVRSSLRQLWLRSRERTAALKAADYSCEECGVKQSRRKGYEQKVEVHHQEEVLNWDTLIDYVYRHLLCHPDQLEVVCPECHKKLHGRLNDD